MTTVSPVPKRGRLRRRIVLAIALLAVVGGGAGVAYRLWKRPEPAPVPPDVPATETEEAVVETIRSARQRVLREPNSARAWGTLGMAFIANDMEDPCLVCFAQAERLDPDNPHWPYYRGGTYLNKGEPAIALPHLQRAVALCERKDPGNQVPRLFLAETLLALGRVEEAAKELGRVARETPDDARTRFDLGLVASSQERWQESADYFRRCLDNPQTQRKAAIKLAEAYQQLGKLDEAEKLQQQVEVLPTDLDWTDPYVTEYLEWAQKKRSRYRLAEQMEASGRLKEAVEVLRPMVEQYPDDHLPAMTLAKLVGRMGDHQLAEMLMRRCQKLAPELVQTHYYLGLVLLMKGETLLGQGKESRREAEEALKEAAGEAKEALARKPDYGLAFMTLGRALKLLGRHKEALDALRRAVDCTPEYGELHYQLAEMLAEDGQEAEARRQLERALELTPQAPWRQVARERVKKVKKDRN
jgi:tetratricopeptide (TPR) repeat protein